MKKTPQFFCDSKMNPYLCNAYHMKQASVSPTDAVGIFYAKAKYNNISSVPCGTLMRPQPVSGGKQWGAELFSYPVINNSIVSFLLLTKMKKTSQFFCDSKMNPYLCIDFHFKSGECIANRRRWHFLCQGENNISSVPCGALMRPLPGLGGSQRGAELFSCPVINNSIVSF